MSLVLRYRAFSLDPVDPLPTTQLPLTPLPPSFKCWVFPIWTEPSWGQPCREVPVEHLEVWNSVIRQLCHKREFNIHQTGKVEICLTPVTFPNSLFETQLSVFWLLSGFQGAEGNV